MAMPEIRVTREEMRKRVAYFKDLKGFDGGLPDSRYPSAVRKLYNAIGFQPPSGKSGGEAVSPVGAQAAENSAIPISEGFNLGFCEARPGNGPMMHNHDTNETFIAIKGTWRVIWGLHEEHSVELGELDVCSVPPFTPRRFINLTPGEGRKEGLLMAVQPGNVAQCEFM